MFPTEFEVRLKLILVSGTQTDISPASGLRVAGLAPNLRLMEAERFF